MALETTTVTGDLTYVDNTELVGATVKFTLSGTTFDKVTGEAILPAAVEQSETTNANGQFSVALWPTDRATTGVSYKVEVFPNGETKSAFTIAALQVPESVTAVDWSTLEMTKPATNKQVVVLTQDELNAAIAANPNYLTGKLVYVQEA